MVEFESHVEDVERLIRTVSAIIKKRGREILADFDITPPQFNALLTLIQSGSLTIGELGERMYLACSTATDLVDRMERNGLVAR
ncbi:MAG: MarR family transcriptional regulator, partial [Bacillota bacterium]|nr:MarR family transcriptional regulator [Bacillota bacterium]